MIFYTLGYFNHIFRLSQLIISVAKKCYQINFLESYFSLVTLATLFHQKTYLASFLVFPPQACNQELPRGRCVRSKEPQISTEMLAF